MPRIKKRRSSRKTYKRKARKATRRVKRYKRSARRSRSNSWSSIGRSALKYGLPLAAGIGKIAGFGDYTGNLGSGQIPSIVNTTAGCIIRHREYIGDLNASAGFVCTAYKLNPGNPQLFPWLSNIARNFEQWCPRGMIVEYKTLSSDTVVNVTSGSPALGSVIMATDYNVYNPAFSTKQQMENYEWAVSCKPSVNMIHQIETKKSQNVQGEYYVTTDPSPQGDDRLYYPGTFNLATVGNQINTVDTSQQNLIGEVWISYEMEFKKPRLMPGVIPTSGTGGIFDHFNFNQDAQVLSSITPLAPFGVLQSKMLAPTSTSTLKGACAGGPVTVAGQKQGYPGNIYNQGWAPFPIYDPLGVQVPATPNTYYFPPSVSSGHFILNYSFMTIGAYGTSHTAVVRSYTNCGVTPIYGNETFSSISTQSVNNTRNIMFIQALDVTAKNASFTFYFTGSTLTGPLYGDLTVTQIADLPL